MSKRSRGETVRRWIEKYCRIPLGPDRGKLVRLTVEQCAIIHQIYDDPDGLQNIKFDDPELSAYLALVHLASPEATENKAAPSFETDSFTIWSAAGSPDLRRVLQRHGETVICPALGTRFPAAA